MVTRKPKVGDAVSHEGNWHDHDHENEDFVVVALKAGGQDPDDPLRRIRDCLCTFENERYKVTCETADLRWLKEDQAWHLVGRLLTRAQRAAFCVLTGSTACHPDGHIGARVMLGLDPERTANAIVVAGKRSERDTVAAELAAAEQAEASEDELSTVRARLVNAELAADAALEVFHG